MNRITSLLSDYARWVWSAIAIGGIVIAVLVWWVDLHANQQQRLTQLQTEAARSAIEVMSSTLNGNLMGSITLLGLIDMDIKQEAQTGLLSIDASIDGTLAAVGASFNAEGVFVVSSDGIVKTSWDRAGKPSTGLDVKFRPYYQMAMQGKTNVYAAVSMARGDRSLYFTAPVSAERAKSTSGVGAVVARTSLERVDKILQDRFDVALLLSPQGVVFAGNRAAWIGRLEGAATPDRLRAIRELRQFGPLFEKNDPEALPVAAREGVQDLEGTRYAVAVADVDWNDPSGLWKLVVMEDMAQSAPLETSATRAAGAAVVFWLLSWMVMHLFKGRHAQNLASEALQRLAQQQEAEIRFRTALGAALVRLQQCQSAAALGESFLRDAHTLFGALQGVVYVRDASDADRFSLQASFACNPAPPAQLRAGQGLLGQCALERSTRVLAADDGGLHTIGSGLGQSAPRTLVMAPVLHNGDALGLVEIALLSEPDTFARASFDEFVQLLGLNLQILVRAHEAMAQVPDQALAEESHE